MSSLHVLYLLDWQELRRLKPVNCVSDNSVKYTCNNYVYFIIEIYYSVFQYFTVYDNI